MQMKRSAWVSFADEESCSIVSRSEKVNLLLQVVRTLQLYSKLLCICMVDSKVVFMLARPHISKGIIAIVMLHAQEQDAFAKPPVVCALCSKGFHSLLPA